MKQLEDFCREATTLALLLAARTEPGVKTHADVAIAFCRIAGAKICWHDAAIHDATAARLNPDFGTPRKANEFNQRSGDYAVTPRDRDEPGNRGSRFCQPCSEMAKRSAGIHASLKESLNHDIHAMEILKVHGSLADPAQKSDALEQQSIALYDHASNLRGPSPFPFCPNRNTLCGRPCPPQPKGPP